MPQTHITALCLKKAPPSAANSLPATLPSHKIITINAFVFMPLTAIAAMAVALWFNFCNFLDEGCELQRG